MGRGELDDLYSQLRATYGQARQYRDDAVRKSDLGDRMAALALLAGAVNAGLGTMILLLAIISKFEGVALKVKGCDLRREAENLREKVTKVQKKRAAISRKFFNEIGVPQQQNGAGKRR